MDDLGSLAQRFAGLARLAAEEAVYRARDTSQHGLPVVLKRLPAAWSAGHALAELLAARSPDRPWLFAAGDGSAWLVRRWAPGRPCALGAGAGTADSAPSSPSPPDFASHAALVADLLAAVADLHATGALHGHLGPGNLLVWTDLEHEATPLGDSPESASRPLSLRRLDALYRAEVEEAASVPAPAHAGPASGGRRRVWLVDAGIGLARFRHAGREFPGAPACLPPELLLGQAPDERTDLYVLGLSLYEALAGTPACDALSTREALAWQLRGLPRPLRRSYTTLPEAVDEVLLRLLAKDPGERFPHARAALRAWKHATGLPVPPAAEAPALGRFLPPAFVGRDGELRGLRGMLREACRGTERPRRATPLLPAPRAAEPATSIEGLEAAAIAGGKEEPTQEPTVGIVRALPPTASDDETGEAFRGGLVVLAGEEGIGKTRLLRELAGRAFLEDVPLLLGRSSERPRWPLEPFAELLREALRREDCPRPRRPPPQLAAAVEAREAAGEAGAATPWPESPAGEEGEAERRAFEDLAGYLVDAARIRPLALAFEDFQHADGATCRQLLTLVRALRVALHEEAPGPAPGDMGAEEATEERPELRRDVPRLFLVATFDPTAGAPEAESLLRDLHQLDAVRVVALPPLDAAAVGAALASGFGWPLAARALPDAFAAAGVGNPLTIAHAAAWLRTAQRLSLTGGGAPKLAWDGRPLDVPAADLPRARAAGLSAAARRVLAAFAVADTPIGRAALAKLLRQPDVSPPASVTTPAATAPAAPHADVAPTAAAASPPSPMAATEDMERGLAEALAEGWIGPDSCRGPGVFCFPHPSYQRLFYGMTEPEERSRLHRQWADLVEGANGPAGGRTPLLDAFHAVRGRRGDRLVSTARAAAAQALARFAPERAVAAVQAALDVARAGTDGGECASAAALRLDLVEALRRAGFWHQAVELLGEAAMLKQDGAFGGDAAGRVDALLRRAAVLERGGRLESAAQACEEAWEAGTGSAAALAPAAGLACGRVLLALGRHAEAERRVREALAMLPAGRAQAEAAGLEALLAETAAARGDRAAEAAAWERSASLRQAAEQPALAAQALQHRALALGEAGRWSESASALQAAGARADDCADYRTFGAALDALARAHEALGLIEEAERDAARSLTVRRGIGDLRGICSGYRTLGLFYAHAAEYGPAIHCLRRAARMARDLADRPLYGECLLQLADAFLAAGHPENAARLATETKALAERLAEPRLPAGLALLDAGLAERRGDHPRAETAAARAEQLFLRAGDRMGLNEARLRRLELAARGTVTSSGAGEPFEGLAASLDPELAAGVLAPRLLLARARTAAVVGEVRGESAAEAEAVCLEAVEAADRLGQREPLWRALAALAGARERLGLPEEARVARRRAAEVARSIAHDLPAELRPGYLASLDFPFASAV